MFVGREEELAFLNERLKSNRFEMIPIYGRRRVGKTRLIEEFTCDKKTIFFTADLLGESSNLANLSKAVTAEITNKISDFTFSSFQEAFEEIADYAKKVDEDVVFVIDEYPYLAGANKGISSILQRAMDKLYLHIPNLMVILTGSQTSFMEQQVMGYQSPLYGRRTGQIKLLPLTFNEARKFLPKMEIESFLTIYGITGGIPLYLSMMDDELSLEENIKQKLLAKHTLLYEEPRNLLFQELRTPDRYNAILMAIAGGKNRLHEIADRTGIDSGLLVSYIKTLIELGVVEKRTPLLSSGKKKGIYYIKDGLFHFWYRYVPHYASFLESGRLNHIWPRVKEDLVQFTALIFEDFCRDWIFFRSPLLLQEVGSWWGNNPLIKNTKAIAEEIDVVGVGLAKNEIVLGECKWRSEITDIRVGEKLMERSQFFPHCDQDLYIFSKSDFSESLKSYAKENDIHLLTFEEMVGG